MKIQKSLILALLLSFGLTGCYTQLEYSKKARRITDEKQVEGYAWDEEAEEKANLTKADSIYIAETYGAKVSPYREGEYDEFADEEYIPIEYKDYDVIDQYEACNCDPYKTYIIYDSYYPSSSWYYGSGYYTPGHHYYAGRYWLPYYGFTSSYYHRWYLRHHFGFGYYNHGFSLAFHWGSPYYYYDPFFYDPFYYGYRSPIFYNSYYFGGYAGTVVRSSRSDRRYGRRSIGADRVRDRNSTAVRTRWGITRSRTNGTTVRGRTTGVNRTRGTVQRTRNTTRSGGTTRVGTSSRTRSGSATRSRETVKRSRSGDNKSSVRSRGSSNIKRERGGNRDQSAIVPSNMLRTRSRNVNPSLINRSQIEARLRQQRIKQIKNESPQRSRQSFMGRFKRILKTGGRIVNTSDNNRSRSTFKVPSRSRTKVGKSSSRSRSSSGTKVRSRSRSSKSSGSSSRSSSSRSSSSKKRSSGNN